MLLYLWLYFSRCREGLHIRRRWQSEFFRFQQSRLRNSADIWESVHTMAPIKIVVHLRGANESVKWVWVVLRGVLFQIKQNLSPTQPITPMFCVVTMTCASPGPLSTLWKYLSIKRDSAGAIFSLLKSHQIRTWPPACQWQQHEHHDEFALNWKSTV